MWLKNSSVAALPVHPLSLFISHNAFALDRGQDNEKGEASRIVFPPSSALLISAAGVNANRSLQLTSGCFPAAAGTASKRDVTRLYGCFCFCICFYWCCCKKNAVMHPNMLDVIQVWHNLKRVFFLLWHRSPVIDGIASRNITSL